MACMKGCGARLSVVLNPEDEIEPAIAFPHEAQEVFRCRRVRRLIDEVSAHQYRERAGDALEVADHPARPNGPAGLPARRQDLWLYKDVLAASIADDGHVGKPTVRAALPQVRRGLKGADLRLGELPDTTNENGVRRSGR
jgi:hypothetical protein